MLGNSFNATGSRNSMKGTITKIAKGTRRNMSIVVRINCILQERRGIRERDRTRWWERERERERERQREKAGETEREREIEREIKRQRNKETKK